MNENHKLVILDDNKAVLASLNDMLNKSSLSCDVYCFLKAQKNFGI